MEFNHHHLEDMMEDAERPTSASYIMIDEPELEEEQAAGGVRSAPLAWHVPTYQQPAPAPPVSWMQPEAALPAPPHTSVPAPSRRVAPLSAKSKPAKPRKPGGKAGITLRMLIEEGILEPGHDVLTVDYKGMTQVASLMPDGRISSSINGQQMVFESPSAFSICVKKLVTPGRKADDGWKTVRYNSRVLEQFKAELTRVAGLCQCSIHPWERIRQVERSSERSSRWKEVHDGPPALNLGNLRKQNVQLIGAVTSIDVCGSVPHDYCASSGTRVHVFDGVTSVKKRQISRFKDRAYGASFRQDGKLIVAGREDSVVQVFDAGSRTLLRQFKGHTAPVHVAKFAAGQLHVLSGSDDSHVSLWDVTSGQQVCTLCGHTDYVRAASNNPASADVWATCGYDHTCKLWDVRHKRCLVTLDHGAPIESVAFFPTGSLLVTAGGTDICIWHMLGSGQLVHRISAHQKTVTSVLVASMTGQAPHIMSAGLDGYVKTLDAETYQPSKVHRYSVPVMSMAASPGGDMLAVGMSDGMLAVHRKKQGPPVTTDATRLRWRPQRAVGARSHYATPKSVGEGLEGEAKVAAQPKVPLPRYEELLLKFRFVEALEAAAATQRDEIVEGVLDLVQQHGALEASLGATPSDLVADLLKHCRRQLCKPQHARNAIAVAECLLSSCIEVIASDEALQHELKRLQGAVAEELRIQEQMMALQGVLGALTAA